MLDLEDQRLQGRVARATSRRRGQAAVVVVASVLGWFLALAALAPAEELPSLSHYGRWLTDPMGRVVILHGSSQNELPATAGYGPEDARFLADNGFNVMRLGLYWWEPTPGTYDDSTVDGYRQFATQLGSAGVHSLVTFQKGIYSPSFPNWMVYTDGLTSNNAGYPLAFFTDPAMNRAEDNFWANRPGPDGIGLQDHVARAWAYLAKRFSGVPGVLGFDLMNEPWPGSLWRTCSDPAGCSFDRSRLSPFYKRVFSAIRAVAPRQLIAYEPNYLFSFGSDTTLDPPRDPFAIFAFHEYCIVAAITNSSCGPENQRPFKNALAYRRRSGDALLLGEWGGVSGPSDIARITTLADKYMLPWINWDYRRMVKDPRKPPTGSNVDQAQLQLLVRPYPQLISGTPKSWSFDPQSKAFTMRYSTKRLAGGRFPVGSRTKLFVPRLQYPDGYRISVTGAAVFPSGVQQYVEVGPCEGAETVSVQISPGTGESSTCQFAPGTTVPAEGCPSTTGSLNARRLGPLTLGMRRATVRRRFPRYGARRRRYIDSYCFSPRGIRAGFPSPTMLTSLRRSERRRVKGRVVLALTGSRSYALHGVRADTPLRAAARRVRVGDGVRIGANTWYVLPNGHSNGLLEVRNGIIKEIGIANRLLTHDLAAARRFLTSLYQAPAR